MCRVLVLLVFVVGLGGGLESALPGLLEQSELVAGQPS